MTNMFRQSFSRLLTLTVAVAAFALTAAEPTVFEFNGKQYYLKGDDLEVATWKYGALGVYTTIHDDWGSTSIKNCYDLLDTMNTNRGLLTSTCAISDYCDQYYVTLGKEFIKHGHDLHSHSVTHTQGMSREEIFQSKADLEAKFEVPVEFYVFPFDQWNDAAIQSLKDAGYIGARSGNRYPLIDAANASGTIPNMTNPADFSDPFALQFDVFPRSNSAYKNVPDNGDATSFLKRYVSDAIEHKGWAIQEFHDINDNNSLSIPFDMYGSLLDSVASAASKNQIWSSGPTDVVRYRFTREYMGAPALTSAPEGYTLNFASPIYTDSLNKYHTAVTLFVRAADMTAHIAAYQNGTEIPSRKIDEGYFALETDPTLGEVSIVSAAKPYMAYPFLDEVDTVPSTYPAWVDYEVYAQGGTIVFHNNALWKNAYWSQHGEPGVDGVWSKVEDVTAKALFARVSKGGTIAPVGKTLVEPGTSQKYVITADAGYEVDYVNVNGVNVGAVYEWTFADINSHNTIEAVLSPIVANGATWTITATATAGGTISPEGARSVREGGSQLYAIEATAGNRLDSVVVNGSNKGAVASYSFTNVTADGTIAAYFSAIPTFTVTTSAEGPGSVTPAGATAVTEGGDLVVSYAADAAARLDSVLVNGTKVTPGSEFIFAGVTANQTLTAYFSAVPQYSIEATAVAGGTIAPEGVVLVTEGADQQFTTAANAGYVFAGLVVDGDTLSVESYTFSDVKATHTIKALYEEVPTFTLTVNQSAGGTISPSTSVINEGASQTITIAPDQGYNIVDVVVNGASVGAVSSYAITSMNSDVTVSASFAIKTFAITATAGANGAISPAGETVVAYGADQAYTITPDANYEIDQLIVNGSAVTVSGSYTFTDVTAASTIAVTFKEIVDDGCADIAAWNASQEWYTYSNGDLREDTGVVYKCIAPAYAYLQPSSAYGYLGWEVVQSCN